MKNPGIWIVFLCFLVSPAASAKDKVKNPHWLSQAEVQAIVAGEPPPPPAGSQAEKDDLQAEIQAEKTRTPERIAEAKLDANYSVRLFTDIVGPRLTPENDPVTFRFFEQLDRQVAKVVGESKDHWKRPRPYLAHPDVIHPIFTANGYSYPSGHSAHAFAFALVLGRLFPDRAQDFIARAEKIARSRVDAGVHYTSDIKEGRVVGAEIVKHLMASDEFQAAFQAAKAEVAARK